MVAHDPAVMAHDLSKGIPLQSNIADVVYHTAVLEHIRKTEALRFMKECHRVLKPRGIIRVGVPDLECICRLYLEKLDAATIGKPGAADDYDWILLEMLDQMVREQSGGEMLDYLRKDPLPNQKFVFDRIGHEGREIVDGIRLQSLNNENQRSSSNISKPSIARRVYGRILSAARNARKLIRSSTVKKVAATNFAIGRFRLGGEVHQWMYDRFSLGRLLAEAGFCEPVLRSATESSIPDWSRFQLDTRSDGTVNKPDLFFMEAIKAEFNFND